MKRIGVTNEGGALIELSAEDLHNLRSAIALMSGFVGGENEPDKIVFRSLAKAASPAAAKACKNCGKPVVGVKGRQCKDCLNAKARANYQPKTKRAQVAKAKATPPPAEPPPPATSEPKPPRRPFGAGMGAKPLVINQEARAKRLAAIKEADRRIAERDPHLSPPQEHGRTLPVGGQD